MWSFSQVPLRARAVSTYISFWGFWHSPDWFLPILRYRVFCMWFDSFTVSPSYPKACQWITYLILSPTLTVTQFVAPKIQCFSARLSCLLYLQTVLGLFQQVLYLICSVFVVHTTGSECFLFSLYCFLSAIFKPFEVTWRSLHDFEGSEGFRYQSGLPHVRHMSSASHSQRWSVNEYTCSRTKLHIPLVRTAKVALEEGLIRSEPFLYSLTQDLRLLEEMTVEQIPLQQFHYVMQYGAGHFVMYKSCTWRYRTIVHGSGPIDSWIFAWHAYTRACTHWSHFVWCSSFWCQMWTLVICSKRSIWPLAILKIDSYQYMFYSLEFSDGHK